MELFHGSYIRTRNSSAAGIQPLGARRIQHLLRGRSFSHGRRLSIAVDYGSRRACSMLEIGNFLCGSRDDKIRKCATAPAKKGKESASSDPPNILAARAGEATEKLTSPAATTFFARLRRELPANRKPSTQTLDFSL
jgi:hypothetical protein